MAMKKILLLRPGAMGDVCMAIPYAAALARQCEVHWLIHRVYEPIPRLFGNDVRLISFDPNARRPISRGLLAQLRAERYDAVLDLAHWPRTAWLVSQLPEIPVRAIAFDPDQDDRLGVNPRELDLYAPFNVRVPAPPAAHQVVKWLEVAR